MQSVASFQMVVDFSFSSPKRELVFPIGGGTAKWERWGKIMRYTQNTTSQSVVRLETLSRFRSIEKMSKQSGAFSEV
jgi:hypothetical protein